MAQGSGWASPAGPVQVSCSGAADILLAPRGAGRLLLGPAHPAGAMSVTESAPPVRGLGGFGGLVPATAWSHSAQTVVAALAVEHHAEATMVPLLILSAAPGVLRWHPEDGLRAADDRRRQYRARSVAVQTGLGAAAATVALEPPIPADASRLQLEVRGLARAVPRRLGGEPVARELSGGPWDLWLDLRPPRTVREPPPDPAPAAGWSRSQRVPTRTFDGFLDLVALGQVRFRGRVAVCAWAIERYRERAVLTVATLIGEGLEAGPITPTDGAAEVWDDLGAPYQVIPIHGASGPGWAESSLEIAPALDPRARALGIRLARLPGADPDGEPLGELVEPFVFGVALPEPPE